MSKPEINVTPLIDVLLVLLIIFMVITPTKPSSFEAKIPSEMKKTEGVEPDPRTLVVVVGKNSNLTLNTMSMEAAVEAPQKLIEKLRDIFQAREENLEPEKTVFIKAPRKLDYGSVAKVIDAVKMSGARPISLQIDELE